MVGARHAAARADGILDRAAPAKLVEHPRERLIYILGSRMNFGLIFGLLGELFFGQIDGLRDGLIVGLASGLTDVWRFNRGSMWARIEKAPPRWQTVIIVVIFGLSVGLTPVLIIRAGIGRTC